MKPISFEVRQKFRWYKENPQELISNIAFMRLPFKEKGIYYELRLRAWIVGLLPRAADDLGFMLRCDSAELEPVIRTLLAHELLKVTDDGQHLYFPMLESHMVENERTITAQREGGARGGRKSAAARKRCRADNVSIDERDTPAGEGEPQGIPQGPSSPSHLISSPSHPVLSVTKGDRHQLSKEQEEWVSDMDRCSPEYLRGATRSRETRLN